MGTEPKTEHYVVGSANPVLDWYYKRREAARRRREIIERNEPYDLEGRLRPGFKGPDPLARQDTASSQLVNARPNVTEDALKAVLKQALRDYFAEFPDAKWVFDGDMFTPEHEVLDLLEDSGALEALQEHIEREIAEPSLKGPDPEAWGDNA